MAQPTTIQVTSAKIPDLTRRYKSYRYAIQMADPGAPTYPAGGIVVDISYAKVLNGTAWYRAKWSSPDLPSNDEIEQITYPGGFSLQLQRAAAGPTMSNFVLRIFTAPGTELGNGAAIPAGLFAALIANAPLLEFELRHRNWKS